MSGSKRALMCVFKLTLIASFATAEVHWPGWLGPDRNGWVQHFTPPQKWPDQLRQGWQVEVGTGYATPLVSEGRIYQYARQGELEVIHCLQLKTGEKIWTNSVEAPFKMGGGGEWHGKGPKGAPVLADGKLFTMGISGALTAWRASDGEILWSRDHSDEYEKLSHPYWGATTSPIVDEGRVVVHFGNDDKGVLVAHDVETGREIWKQDKDAPSYSSPLLAHFGGIRQIVEWNHRAVVGIESETGRQLWEFPFEHVETNQNMPTPAIWKDRVLVGGENRGVRSVQPILKDGVWTVAENWHQKEVALDMSSAIVNGENLYGFSHYGRGRLFCLDIETGEVRWQGPGRTGDNVTFLAIPGHIVALIDKGELQIIKASSERFEKVADYLVADSPTWAAPVLLENAMLIKDQTKLTYWAMD